MRSSGRGSGDLRSRGPTDDFEAVQGEPPASSPSQPPAAADGCSRSIWCRSEVPCTAAGKTARDCNADWLDALQGAHPGIRQSPPTDRERSTRGDSRRDGIFWHDQHEAPRTADSAGCKHRQSRADRRRVSRVTPSAVFHPCRRTRARSSTLFWAVPGRGLLRFFNPVREAHRAGGRGPGAAFLDLEKQWEQRAGRPRPR